MSLVRLGASGVAGALSGTEPGGEIALAEVYIQLLLGQCQPNLV
jgi:hypothetical protein